MKAEKRANSKQKIMNRQKSKNTSLKYLHLN